MAALGTVLVRLGSRCQAEWQSWERGECLRPARCRVLAELGTAKMRLVPGDSLGATLETRRECVSFQVT
ncbi:hypothetical protein GBAR_LOCUS13784, partial [Geodia barretti]